MKTNSGNNPSTGQTSSTTTETVGESPTEYGRNDWRDRHIAAGNALMMMADYVRHRVNTQVSNLGMINQLIRETPLNEEQQELIDNYGQITKELSDLITTIADNCLLVSYQKQDVQPIKLQPLFDQVKQRFASRIEEGRATLYADFSEKQIVQFEPNLLYLLLERFISSSLDQGGSVKNLEMKVYTVVKSFGDHLVFENNAPVSGILHNGETSDQTMFSHNINAAIMRCGAQFKVEIKERFGNRYSVIFN